MEEKTLIIIELEAGKKFEEVTRGIHYPYDDYGRITKSGWVGWTHWVAIEPPFTKEIPDMLSLEAPRMSCLQWSTAGERMEARRRLVGMLEFKAEIVITIALAAMVIYWALVTSISPLIIAGAAAYTGAKAHYLLTLYCDPKVEH